MMRIDFNRSNLKVTTRPAQGNTKEREPSDPSEQTACVNLAESHQHAGIPPFQRGTFGAGVGNMLLPEIIRHLDSFHAPMPGRKGPSSYRLNHLRVLRLLRKACSRAQKLWFARAGCLSRSPRSESLRDSEEFALLPPVKPTAGNVLCVQLVGHFLQERILYTLSGTRLEELLE